jgi:glycolate oxidase FAD binding subunit
VSLGAGFVRGRLREPEPTQRAMAALRERLVRVGGALVLERAPPALLSGIDAWGPVGSALAVMRELKQRFDPEGRLSPGRFVGGI